VIYLGFVIFDLVLIILMYLYIYTLRGTLYEGECFSLTAPAETGEITILPNHIPLITALKVGTLRYTNSQEQKEIALQDGFLYTDGKKTVILVR